MREVFECPGMNDVPCGTPSPTCSRSAAGTCSTASGPPDRPHEPHLGQKTPGPVRYVHEPEVREWLGNPEGEVREVLRAIHGRSLYWVA
jgi:hypothetical protein